MSEKSSFRSLLEMSDKIAREELGDYYVMGASRMNNMLDCLESGAEQIQKLTAENAELLKVQQAYLDQIDVARKLRETLDRIGSMCKVGCVGCEAIYIEAEAALEI